MQVSSTKLEGVIYIVPKRFGDPRGFFTETYSRRAYAKAGIALEFVQDNHSLSAEVGTVRGLHFQTSPHAQGKLVRCVRGAIFDVAVDIRKNSPTWGQWVGYELSEENGAQLYISTGFAHGFMTLCPNSEVIYKCTDYYAPETEGALRWNDPDISIDWPMDCKVILSEKDMIAPQLNGFDSPFSWGGDT